LRKFERFLGYRKTRRSGGAALSTFSEQKKGKLCLRETWFITCREKGDRMWGQLRKETRSLTVFGVQNVAGFRSEGRRAEGGEGFRQEGE